MRHTNLLLLLVSILTLSACARAGKEVAEELGIIPSTCGSDGARVEASVNGNSFCADGNVSAISEGTSATVIGLGLLGSGITLQVDTLATGTYVMDEAENSLLYMELGTPYTSFAGQPGTLTISGHDAANHRLKASFDTHVRNEMSGTVKPVSGTVDVTYTIEG